MARRKAFSTGQFWVSAQTMAPRKLSPAIVEMEITKERLRVIPLALAEAVKPLEKIGEVKIVDLGGALGRGAGGGQGSVTGGASDNLLSMLLAYRAQAPMVDQLLKESGFTGQDPMAGLMNAVSPAQPPAAESKPDKH